MKTIGTTKSASFGWRGESVTASIDFFHTHLSIWTTAFLGINLFCLCHAERAWQYVIDRSDPRAFTLCDGTAASTCLVTITTIIAQYWDRQVYSVASICHHFSPSRPRSRLLHLLLSLPITGFIVNSFRCANIASQCFCRFKASSSLFIIFFSF